MNNIKTKRLEIGYKQYKIAQKLGISLRHYARLENNERMAKKDEIKLLAKIFNCTINDLEFGGS